MDTQQGHFRWKLRETIDGHSITRYALQQRAGVAMNTVRAMYDGTPEQVNFSTIEKVVAALQEMTGQPMTAADVLIWEPSDRPQRTG